MSADETNALFDAIKEYDGYPKLKELVKMVPSLTPMQVEAALRYLERSGAISIDDQGHVIWARREPRPLSFSEVASMSPGFSEFVKGIERERIQP